MSFWQIRRKIRRHTQEILCLNKRCSEPIKVSKLRTNDVTFFFLRELVFSNRTLSLAEFTVAISQLVISFNLVRVLGAMFGNSYKTLHWTRQAFNLWLFQNIKSSLLEFQLKTRVERVCAKSRTHHLQYIQSNSIANTSIGHLLNYWFWYRVVIQVISFKIPKNHQCTRDIIDTRTVCHLV